MKIRSPKIILARVAAGTTTVHDAEALRAWLRRIPRLAQELDGESEDPSYDGTECPAGMHYGSWTPRLDAEATVALTYVQDRYARGEIVIQTHYRLTDGTRETDPSRRVHLAREAGTFIRELWELLFETACALTYSEVASVAIHLGFGEIPDGAHYHVRAVAEIIAAELHVHVTGTAPLPGSIWASPDM